LKATNGLSALVLAGSRPGGDSLARHAGVSHKALIEIGGRSMIERVVAALAAVPEVTRILIAIDRPEVLSALPGLRAPRCPKPVVTVPAAETPSTSVAAVLEREGTPLLVTTADHALLVPQWLHGFIDACPPEADVVAALARKDAVLACAPGTQRTYLRFADGDYSGCNLFCFQRPGAGRVVRLWRELEAHRKSPLKMMLRLGMGTALRYRLGQLRLADALARLGELSNTQVRVVELADGRAAIDVDKPADLELVRSLAATP
jgi:GTP:adenosylcobinamide-phosphate guanylyltransferase